ncbi:MAG: PIN domain-containing protein [Alphaproteobacteria bacterium HGW-Alphaproteobacteria-2]|nr:MAG: PIN domain-containing protein [Alphaproteobacteria bacterium HGW-Alphaproteobacteria-2]
MRVLIDACVLYPTVLREVVMGVAEAGLFTPLWSARILEEWAHAAARLGQGAVALAEIAALADAWPGALVTLPEGAEAGLSLPDPGDVHVLAAAIAGRADVLLTLNARDFPSRVLARHDILRREPDGLLREMWGAHPEAVAGVARAVQARAEALSGTGWPMRRLMKKAGLPRLGKALAGG